MSVAADINSALAVWEKAGYRPTALLCTADVMSAIGADNFAGIPIVICSAPQGSWGLVSEAPWTDQHQEALTA